MFRRNRLIGNDEKFVKICKFENKEKKENKKVREETREQGKDLKNPIRYYTNSSS